MNGIFPAQVDFFLVRNLPQIHGRNFFFDDFSLPENGRDVILIFPSCNWRTVHFDYPYIRGSWKTTRGHHSTPQASPPPPQETLLLVLALFLEGNLPCFFVLLCIWGRFPSTSPPVAGGLYLEVLIHGGAYFRNLTVYQTDVAIYRKIPPCISPSKYKPSKPVTQKLSVKSPLQI